MIRINYTDGPVHVSIDVPPPMQPPLLPGQQVAKGGLMPTGPLIDRGLSTSATLPPDVDLSRCAQASGPAPAAIGDGSKLPVLRAILALLREFGLLGR